MAIHIGNFEICSYRGMKDLKLEKLNDINILTGDNNSGKTSVLELLYTTTNPGDIKKWYLGTRISNNVRNRRIYEGFYNMFPVDDEEKVIQYRFEDGENKSNEVSIYADMANVEVSEREMYKFNGLSKAGSRRNAEDDEMVDSLCMTLRMFLNGQEEGAYDIYDFQTRMYPMLLKKTKYWKAVYNSPVSYLQQELELSEILEDPELYEELISILKEFDEHIINVNAISPKDFRVAPNYMILTDNHKKALPLNVYGDGMKKALSLLCSVIRAKGGILLLDEFETAIHTSAMDSIFSWLLQSAMKMDVQVFLTSHSKEAIDKVLKSKSELQSHINVYTLYNYQGHNYVRRMACEEAINAQDDLGVDLR